LGTERSGYFRNQIAASKVSGKPAVLYSSHAAGNHAWRIIVSKNILGSVFQGGVKRGEKSFGLELKSGGVPAGLSIPSKQALFVECNTDS
jgi:hypothetical protein